MSSVDRTSTPPRRSTWRPREAQQVADGLWLLAGRPRHAINVYVVGDVLVDAGTRQSATRILRQVRGLPLRALAVTHGHLDHIGAAHEVCEALGLPVLCGEPDRAAVESGGRDGLAEKPALMRLEHRLVAGPGHPVAETLAEGSRVGGFSVLEVPGHSPGHLAFWRERDRVLVLGDVLFNFRLPRPRPGLRLPPALFTPDPGRQSGFGAPPSGPGVAGGVLRPRAAAVRRRAAAAVCG